LVKKQHEPPQRTLADRLNHLFATVRGRGGREYSNDEVAAAITAKQGVSISGSYLWYLRTGARDNPTLKHLTALAEFFGVPPAYFFDESIARQVDAELRVATAMRDAGVRDIALRATGLSAASLETISDLVERVRQLEGLPDETAKPDE
jgi:transcriptional regulator with XRE-family HTH domain